MATQRVVLDGAGNNILSLFENNMTELGKLNQLAANSDNVGVYHGPDDAVNINYPRDGTSYNRIGRAPGSYEAYHVREITFNPSQLEEANHLISKEQNDGKLVIPSEEKSEYSFHGKSNTTLLQNYGLYSNEGGTADPSKFMELKGRKSLFTLLQETRAAFFDDKDRSVYRSPTPGWWRSPTNQSNKYGDNYESYDYKYYQEQGRSFVDAPGGFDISNQALHGFALGQILAGDATIEDRLKTEASNLTRGYLENLGIEAGARGDSILQDYYSRLVLQVSNTERVSQLYVAGWGRPAENWLTKKPLSEVLNQNILLPPTSESSYGLTDPLSMPGNSTGNGQGGPGFGDTAANFAALYTRNRSGQAGGVNVGNPVFNNGVIAGTAVNLLQEPSKNMTADIITGAATPENPDFVPFSFEKDDAQYLTYDRKEAGFATNGPNTNTQPAMGEPAVKDFQATPDGYEGNYHLGADVVGMSQGQHFPFVFSTVNKKNNRFQVCFLQGTLASLSESYTPTWAARHFFGRSEQAHTYTFTDRTIDMSFSIFANEMRQLQNVYERVLWLAQQCYPDYDVIGRMQAGPLIAMRVGDLFQYKVGMIRSLAIDWLGFNGGKWEMTAGMKMPQGCTVTLSYQIIHNDIPDRDYDFYGGPAGGLNAATERWRQISGGGADGAFKAFEDLDTGSVGYGSEAGGGGRLLDSGVLNAGLGEMKSYLDMVKDNNYSRDNRQGLTTASKSLVQRVPVGVDSDGLSIDQDGKNYSDY